MAPTGPEIRAAGQSSDRTAPDIEAVLRRVDDYLRKYEREISAIVAEEDCRQQYVPALSVARQFSRRLKSKVIVLSDPVHGWVAFRDVFEVDGRPVRDRDQRLLTLLTSPAADARAQALAIAAESARFNLNISRVSVNRTLNVPTAALLFFRQASQPRSAFTVDRLERIRGRPALVVKFVEQTLPRLIASPTNVAMTGAAWVEPETGRIVRTSLDYTLADGAVSTKATIVVDYTEDSHVQMLVPATMNERYEARDGPEPVGTLLAQASYSQFRRFSVDVSPDVVSPPAEPSDEPH